jgi:hypothetical protein
MILRSIRHHLVKGRIRHRFRERDLPESPALDIPPLGARVSQPVQEKEKGETPLLVLAVGAVHQSTPSQRIFASGPPCSRHSFPSKDGTNPISQSFTRGKNGYSSVLIFSVYFQVSRGSRKNEPQ